MQQFEVMSNEVRKLNETHDARCESDDSLSQRLSQQIAARCTALHAIAQRNNYITLSLSTRESQRQHIVSSDPGVALQKSKNRLSLIISMPDCPYDTLNVSKDASTEAIKAAYRQLAKEKHPDVAGKNATNTKAFARISDAASILTNPSKRRQYDRSRQNAASNPFRSGFHPYPATGGFTNHGRARGAATQTPTAGMHGLFYTMFRPRNLILGPLCFFGLVAGLQYVFGTTTNDKQRNLLRSHPSNQLVQAWHNPRTGEWEQPAPWDPVYRQLKPDLQMIPRRQVRARKM